MSELICRKLSWKERVKCIYWGFKNILTFSQETPWEGRKILFFTELQLALHGYEVGKKIKGEGIEIVMSNVYAQGQIPSLFVGLWKAIRGKW